MKTENLELFSSKSRELIFLVLFFTMGLGFYGPIAILLLGLCVFFFLLDRYEINYMSLGLYLAFFTLYIFQWHNIQIENSEATYSFRFFFSITLSTLSVLLSLSFLRPSSRFNALLAFLIGGVMKWIVLCSYNLIFLTENFTVTRRVIFNPFNDKMYNNLLFVYAFIIAFEVITLYLIKGDFKKTKLSMILSYTLLIGIKFFLIISLSRTPNILLALFFISLLLCNKVFKLNLSRKHLTFILLLTFIPEIVFYIVKKLDFHVIGHDKSVVMESVNDYGNRWRAHGLQSLRFELLVAGFKNALSHPWGGGSVPKLSETTYWFHNLWLDIVRTSGLIPLLVLVVIQFKILLSSLRSLKDNNFELFIIWISTLLIYGTSIPLEYDTFLWIFGVMIGEILLRNKLSTSKVAVISS